MAVVGALLIIKNAFRKGSNTQVLFLVVCLVSGGIYFIQPSIVPDQIWAMRRFLVGVFPALFILASLVLAQVDLVKMLPRIVKVGITLVGALAIMLPPALVSRHYVVRPTYQSQLSQVHAMCDTLEPNDLVIWVGILYKTALQSTRAYCGNDAVGMQEPSAPQLLAVAEEVRQIGKRPVVMLIGNDMSYFPLDIAKLSPISGIDYSVLERVLYGPPKNLLQNQRTIYRGVL